MQFKEIHVLIVTLGVNMFRPLHYQLPLKIYRRNMETNKLHLGLIEDVAVFHIPIAPLLSNAYRFCCCCLRGGKKKKATASQHGKIPE